MDILILDLVHGGDILAEDLMKKGNRVTCVDVYGIASKEKKQHLADIGATVESTVPERKYDLLLSPIHCPDTFLNGATFDGRRSFHEEIGELIADRRFRIEITGVKGKTSCCYMLAHIIGLTDKKVFLHTSRGQGPWTNGKHRIDALMSIAPTSLLRLPGGDYDVMITEVSLGGSGKADIAVITNLVEDYGIAHNTKKASDAKSSILTNGINIVSEKEIDIWKKYGNHEFTPYGEYVKIIGTPQIGKPLEIAFQYDGERRITLDPSYLSIQYIQSMDVVLRICESLDIPAETVIKGLQTFKGVPGRGEISFTNGIWHITERNPGISHISIANTLDCLSRLNALDGAVAIVDPISKKVCDKLHTDEIRKAVSKYDVTLLFTDGKGSKPDIPKGTKTIIEFIKEGYQ